MAQDTNLIGQLTGEQIADLKKKHPRGLFALIVGGHIAYFSKPNRHDMKAAMSAVSAEDPLAYFESLMADTFQAGSRFILEDDDLFMDAIKEFKHIEESQKAELVKL